MKILTVRHPWAEAVVDGAKPIENRASGFPKTYRGPLAIHSAATWSPSGFTDRRLRELWPTSDPRGYALRHVPTYRGRPPHPFVPGAVIGFVDVVDIHPASGCCAPWGEETYSPANPEQRPPGRVTHLVFENARRLERPIPARGALGLWTPDDDLALELAEVLAC